MVVVVAIIFRTSYGMGMKQSMRTFPSPESFEKKKTQIPQDNVTYRKKKTIK